jgi:nucleolysin TIA-1/TIAR
VNWAFAGSNAQKEDTTHHFHIFVGDLSPEINDLSLGKAFSSFPSISQVIVHCINSSESRVMWDLSSGKSRGYGFVAFREKADAEKAIATMNGEWIGNRAIRCNWANQKNSATSASHSTHNIGQDLNYEHVVSQTSSYNTSVYVGNLAPTTTRKLT